MINLIENKYVCELPEYHLYQDCNPDNGGQPFATEEAAQAWEDAYKAVQVAAADTHAAEARAKLAAELTLSVTLAADSVQINTPLAATVEIRNGLGQVVPVTRSFAVPICDADGFVTMIKGVSFVAGVASVSLTFTKSGYYHISEAEINRKLVGMFLRLPVPVEVTVFE